MQGLYGGRGPHAFPLAGLSESDGEYTGGMGYHRTQYYGLSDHVAISYNKDRADKSGKLDQFHTQLST